MPVVSSVHTLSLMLKSSTSPHFLKILTIASKLSSVEIRGSELTSLSVFIESENAALCWNREVCQQCFQVWTSGRLSGDIKLTSNSSASLSKFLCSIMFSRMACKDLNKRRERRSQAGVETATVEWTSTLLLDRWDCRTRCVAMIFVRVRAHARNG